MEDERYEDDKKTEKKKKKKIKLERGQDDGKIKKEARNGRTLPRQAVVVSEIRQLRVHFQWPSGGKCEGGMFFPISLVCILCAFPSFPVSLVLARSFLAQWMEMTGG